jgi:hypothetical protein
MITELRLILVLISMLTLPGWALLTFNDAWRQWRGVQRWVVAVGISIACYPVLFYGLRSVFPFLTLGPYKMSALLLVFGAVIVWRMRGHWREQFTFDQLEWVALGIFGMTLFTRIWIIRDHPYPAWSDSLHHTLLTQLTATQGKLPVNMEPYSPVALGQYHLGLYSLSATVQWLAQVPAHTALLWTAQVLNGLCGLGVYLLLDRKVGRVGAVVGAAVVGLLSHQPAWYVNWGRFTQLAGQTILLIAWLVTWEAIALWGHLGQGDRGKILWNSAAAAVLTGAMFLMHFRVALFSLPLLAVSTVWELWKSRRENRIGFIVLGAVAIGVVALLVITPALWEALHIHVDASLGLARVYQSGEVPSEVSQAMERFYEFSPRRDVPSLAVYPWLIVVSGLSAMIGLLRCNRLVITSLVWIAILYLAGNAYLLKSPLLNITNLGAVLIMWYLPVGLIIGSAVQEAVILSGPHQRERIVRLIIVLVSIAGFIASHVRVTEIELYRYFVTPEDVVAMDWIKENTPPDALFAVNTYFWLPKSPHGTDAGYWIPYFTGRQTTVGTMLAFANASEYKTSLVQMSRAVEQLESDNTSLADLREMGVDYVYIGRKGDFSGPGLNVARLIQSQHVQVLYQDGGVSILQIGASD